MLGLPETFSSLSRLTYLDVSLTHCDLGDIFRSPCALPSLAVLTFTYPRDGGIVPDVVFRPSLRKLTIVKVDGPLPESLGRAVGLTLLSLSGHYQRGSLQLPDSLGDLRELKVLEISRTDLESLPQSFTRLSKLEQLKAHNNRLSSLPPIDSLVLLQYIGVSENSLTTCPPLSGLQNLRYIHLGHNRLETPPEGLLSLPSLRLMTLDSRCFDRLSESEREEYARLPI